LSTQKKVDEYLLDDLNEDLAIECAHKLWNLCDWYYEENKANLGYNQLSDFQGGIGKQCPSLRIIRDVSNGSKHANISKTRNPVVHKTIRHDGDFTDEFTREFDVSVLEVELTDGSTWYFDEIVKEVLAFWRSKLEP
jgi:hypothetical protein